MLDRLGSDYSGDGFLERFVWRITERKRKKEKKNTIKGPVESLWVLLLMCPLLEHLDGIGGMRRQSNFALGKGGEHVDSQQY